MQTIKRDIYVTKNVLQAPIEVTEGTNSIALEFDIKDYTIPGTAAAVVYSMCTSTMLSLIKLGRSGWKYDYDYSF